jgi:anaerobic ribonucleoside-triphosphate reductase activating protein
MIRPNRLLNVAAVEKRTFALAPGGAFCGVFVQGCPQNCPGCAAPDFRDMNQVAHLISPEQLAAYVLELPDIIGVALSGGEPFHQAASLVPFAARVKQAGLFLVSYSGFTLEELRADPVSLSLLTYCDLLIDGPYIEELADQHLAFRGSSNQRLCWLNNEYRKLARRQDRPVHCHVTVREDGITLTGSLAARLSEAWKSKETR